MRVTDGCVRLGLLQALMSRRQAVLSRLPVEETRKKKGKLMSEYFQRSHSFRMIFSLMARDLLRFDLLTILLSRLHDELLERWVASCRLILYVIFCSIANKNKKCVRQQQVDILIFNVIVPVKTKTSLKFTLNPMINVCFAVNFFCLISSHASRSSERSHAGRFKSVDSGDRPTDLYSEQTVQSTARPPFLQKALSVRHVEAPDGYAQRWWWQSVNDTMQGTV